MSHTTRAQHEKKMIIQGFKLHVIPVDANVTKFFTLAIKSWKLVAKLATRISDHILPRDLVIVEDL